ncbi:MAG: hypothetical protein OEZ05_10245 [Nitrospirota bacterium]|nr:hypothetical protein [Nitrospirota bacterium]
MIQICAWCQQEGLQDVHRQMSERPLAKISHGICPDHARRLRHSYRPSLFREPVATSPGRSFHIAS